MHQIPQWPYFNQKEKEHYDNLITHTMKNEWLGLVLRYDDHWGVNKKSSAFVITSDTTLEQFKQAVETKIMNSGDRHHIYIEKFRPNGMWLDIQTGS